MAKHAFWPLIAYKIETFKIRKDEDNGKLVKKPKLRDIAYAAHSDSHIFSFYCQELAARYELEIQNRDLCKSVLAFRSLGLNNINFAKEAFEEIRRQGDCTAIAFDISKFFDTIDHGLLKASWRSLIGKSNLPSHDYAVFRALTRYSKVDRDELFDALGISVHNPRAGRRRVCTPAEFRAHVRGGGLIKVNQNSFGIPQGTAISAMLSNLYMLEFDTAAKAQVDAVGGKYMRYCDDMLFIVPTENSEAIQEFANAEIKKLKLEVNSDKTDVSCFSKIDGTSELQCTRPLQYLGFLFDGQRTIIRSSAFAKFSNRMRRGVSLAKQTMRSSNKERAIKGHLPRPLFLRNIYSRYSHLGARNFLRYGYRAAEVMESPHIRRQLRPLWDRLLRVIEK